MVSFMVGLRLSPKSPIFKVSNLRPLTDEVSDGTASSSSSASSGGLTQDVTVRGNETREVHLPSDVIQEVLLFVDHGRDACQLASTCRLYHQIIHQDVDHLWREYCGRRWQRGVRDTIDSYKEEYARKHSLDCKAWERITDMAIELEKVMGDSCGSNQDEWSHPHWPWLLRMGTDVFDACLAVAGQPADCSLAVCRQFVASNALLVFHRLECYQNLWSARIAGTTDSLEAGPELSQLYESYGLLAASIEVREEEVSSAMLSSHSIAEYVCQTLDALAMRAQQRIIQLGVSDIESQLRAVSKVLFEEEGYTARLDARQECGIHRILRTRSGRSLDVALVYLYVCHRIGLHLSVVGPNSAEYFWAAVYVRYSSTDGQGHLYIDMYDKVGSVMREDELQEQIQEGVNTRMVLDPACLVARSLIRRTRQEDYLSPLHSDLVQLLFEDTVHDVKPELAPVNVKLPDRLFLRGLQSRFDRMSSREDVGDRLVYRDLPVN